MLLKSSAFKNAKSLVGNEDYWTPNLHFYVMTSIEGKILINFFLCPTKLDKNCKGYLYSRVFGLFTIQGVNNSPCICRGIITLSLNSIIHVSIMVKYLKLQHYACICKAKDHRCSFKNFNQGKHYKPHCRLLLSLFLASWCGFVLA